MTNTTRSSWHTVGRIAIVAAAVGALAFAVVLVVGQLRGPHQGSATRATPTAEGTTPSPEPPGPPPESGPDSIPSAPPQSPAAPASPVSAVDGSQRLQLLIAEGQIDQMLEVGNAILAGDPENLNVLHALAFQLRHRELLASPRNYAHATEAVELSRKAIHLVESGRSLAGVDNFNKEATLAWLYQNLAIVESRDGMSDTAIESYEKSTSFAPLEPDIAGRNLAELMSWRQATYDDAVSAYDAFPAEARGAAEPSAEVTAARDALNAAADDLIDVSARFVALAEMKNLPRATRDRVYSVLESAYRTRHPDDAEADGLQAVIDSKK